MKSGYNSPIRAIGMHRISRLPACPCLTHNFSNLVKWQKLPGLQWERYLKRYLYRSDNFVDCLKTKTTAKVSQALWDKLVAHDFNGVCMRHLQCQKFYVRVPERSHPRCRKCRKKVWPSETNNISIDSRLGERHVIGGAATMLCPRVFKMANLTMTN